MLKEYFKPLGTGDILDGAFQLYRRGFATLLLTSLILFLPAALMTPFSTSMAGTDFVETEINGAWVLGFFLIVLLSIGTTLVIWPAMVRQFDQLLHGRPVTVGDGMKVGIRKAVPLLGSSVLIGVGLMMLMMVVFIPVVILVAALGVAAGGEMSTLSTAVVFGVVILLYVVILVIAAMLIYGLVPAMVVEGTGPIQSIVRSIHLSKGRRPRIVAVVIVAFLIQSLPTIAVGIFTGAFAALGDPTAVATVTGTQIAVQSLGSYIAGALAYPYLIATMVLLYYDGRVRLEGYDLEIASQGLSDPEAGAL